MEKPFQFFHGLLVGTRGIGNILTHLWITIQYVQLIEVIHYQAPK